MLEATEPPDSLTDPAELLAAYLDFFRAAVLRKLDGLPEGELRGSRLPSGWTPLELLKHLAAVERRWLCWGFAGEQIADPWLDNGPDERWQVGPEETVDDVRTFFLTQRDRSLAVVSGASLGDRASDRGRFADHEGEPPTLSWILFHLLQEYARHVGHLDVVRELIDGAVGE